MNVLTDSEIRDVLWSKLAVIPGPVQVAKKHDHDDGHDDNYDHILCRDLTIFSVASEARTWLPGLEQVLQAHNDLPDKVVESPLCSCIRLFKVPCFHELRILFYIRLYIFVQAWFSTVFNSRDVTRGGIPLWQIVATVVRAVIY